jgi:DNA-binding transcriptional regulator YhcF (GntR family)
MDFKSGKAIYLQIADYFYESILQKGMKADDRIPSVRDLAVEIEVNPNTVMRTYTLLQNQGIIYRKRGIGYFISDEAYETVHRMKKDEFISEKLPAFFKTMNNLNITIDDINHFFQEYLNNKFKTNENESK